MIRKLLAGVLAFGAMASFAPNLFAQGQAKKMPARDAKGRFVKKGAEDHGHGAMAGKMEGAKKMPARDPKTGRFIKKM